MQLAVAHPVVIVGFALRQDAEYTLPMTRLAGLHGTQLLETVWAFPTKATARQLKDDLRGFLDEHDRILVVEAGSTWASRHAFASLETLIPPPGGPALMLWKRKRDLDR